MQGRGGMPIGSVGGPRARARARAGTSPKQKTVLALTVPFSAGCWLICLNFWPPGRARAAPKSSRGQHRFLGRPGHPIRNEALDSFGQRARSDWSSTGRLSHKPDCGKQRAGRCV